MPDPMRSRLVRIACATVALTLVAGAGRAAEKIESHWKDPAWKTPLSNVYVVAVRPSAERRIWWEDGFVTGLTRYHVRATASYQKFRDAPPDTQQVIAEVRAGGVDGVLGNAGLTDATAERHHPYHYAPHRDGLGASLVHQHLSGGADRGPGFAHRGEHRALDPGRGVGHRRRRSPDMDRRAPHQQGRELRQGPKGGLGRA